jgi:hypothetical protein
MLHTEPPAVERSLALYLALLRAYPPAFRERYGQEMALAFRDAARDAWTQTGFFGLIALWARTLADTLVNATIERVRGTDEAGEAERWSAFPSTFPTRIALACAGVIAWRFTQHWLPAFPLANRGWPVLVGSALLGLLLASSERASHGGFGWRRWVRWSGVFGWMLWTLSSTTLGIDAVGSMLPVAFIGMVAWRGAFLTTPDGRPTRIGGKDHLFIAAPALLLLVAPSPGTPVATNVFLAFVAVANVVSAALLWIAPRSRKSEAEAK